MEILEPRRELHGCLVLTRCGTDSQTTEIDKNKYELGQIHTTCRLRQTFLTSCLEHWHFGYHYVRTQNEIKVNFHFWQSVRRFLKDQLHFAILHLYLCISFVWSFQKVACIPVPQTAPELCYLWQPKLVFISNMKM